MSKNVLFTGGSGFIGKNVIPILSQKYNIYAPRRFELDLKSTDDVAAYIKANNISVVMHCANPNPSKNILDKTENMLRESLEIFLSIYNCRKLVEKVVYLGSGAVYDKSKDIISASEEMAFGSLPVDDYGFAKYVINTMTIENIYNLCVFGCYGPGDAESKFITHCIRCCLKNEPITIRQNCMFDYMHVTDLGKMMSWIIDTNPKYNMYNACSGRRISLLEIAQIVKCKMNSESEIVILKDGWNKEYTASNKRLMGEYQQKLVDLETGILMQIKWEKNHFKCKRSKYDNKRC